jgi:hypothetical protein
LFPLLLNLDGFEKYGSMVFFPIFLDLGLKTSGLNDTSTVKITSDPPGTWNLESLSFVLYILEEPERVGLKVNYTISYFESKMIFLASEP